MKILAKEQVINQKETFRYLGYGNNAPDETMQLELKECVQEFLQVVEPKFDYQIFELLRREERLFTKDEEFEFTGSSLKKHLNNCEYVAFGCATLSKKVDSLIDYAQKHDMLKALLFDAIANAAIEEVRKALEDDLSKSILDANINWLFGIGYGDSELSIQPSFLAKINAAKTLGVTVNEHFILQPLKTVTGFIGISTKQVLNMKACKQTGCVTCNMQEKCSYRA